MVADIDIIIPIGLLLAMWLSNEPKRSAIAFIILISLSITGIDYFVTAMNGWLSIYLSSILESSGAIVLILAARKLPELKDRMFFWLMGLLLLMSSAITAMLIIKGFAFHGSYVFASELIAIIHLSIMLSFSDGIRNFVGNIRNSLITYRGGFTNFRGES